MYNRLYIFVEGDDDERFVRGVLIPLLNSIYNLIQIVQYSQRTQKFVNSFINSIMNIDNTCYLFFADSDENSDIIQKKKCVKSKYASVDEDKIIIVIKEIESWYLAGLNEHHSKRLGLNHYLNTNDISKEQFIGIMPKKYVSKINFMSEILKCYCKGIAMQKNSSFKYALRKCTI